MKLVEPDYFAIAWAAQARWLWERTPEAHLAFERAMEAYLAQSKKSVVSQFEISEASRFLNFLLGVNI